MVKGLQLALNFLGPVLFIIINLMPVNLQANQQRFLACFVFVVCGWLFTKTPLFVTGFLGVAAAVFSGVTSPTNALAPFANPIVFLFLGGFLLARAMYLVELDRRISLYLLSRPFIKGSLLRMLIVLYGVTAFFSMWLSNTATAAMMLPIILGILKSLNVDDKRVTTLFLLGMAYTASIGGLATPVGSTPNIIAIGLLSELAQINVNFLQWCLMGIPFVMIFVSIIIYYIYRALPSQLSHFDNSFVVKEYERLPKISKNEIYVVTIFLLTVAGWFAPSIMSLFVSKESAQILTERMSPGIIAIFFPSLLFLSPLKGNLKILTSTEIKSIDWGSLLLFGSGLTLGKLLFDTGLAALAGDLIVQHLVGGSLFFTLVVLVFTTIFATEVTSNTASANIIIPIVIAMALQLNSPTLVLVVAIAFSCSLAFMLPVATPPNAIVYGSEKVEMKDMIKLGFKLNLICGVTLVFAFYILSYFH
jgi:sodium-dependent dicarboxylate transporter 2/3/5